MNFDFETFSRIAAGVYDQKIPYTLDDCLMVFKSYFENYEKYRGHPHPPRQMKKYEKLDQRIAELEATLSGGLVTWTDRRGEHTGTWEAFRGSVFFVLAGRMSPLNPEDCPLLSFDMDQAQGLPPAQQLGLSVFLNWIGFPAMELVKKLDGTEVWENRKGVVTLEG